MTLRSYDTNPAVKPPKISPGSPWCILLADERLTGSIQAPTTRSVSKVYHAYAASPVPTRHRQHRPIRPPDSADLPPTTG